MKENNNVLAYSKKAIPLLYYHILSLFYEREQQCIIHRFAYSKKAIPVQC